MGTADPIIRLRDVAFNYNADRAVFDGLEFEMGPVDRIGVTGANGTGKTTLLHLLVGLLRPQRGEVEIFGSVRRCEEDFLEVRQRMGLLFQDPEDQLFCPTVGEDVAFGPLNLGRTREEVVAIVRETLSAIGLEGFEERVTYRLSFGEKRLVSLATVLAMQPEVLLLDEPTASLSPEAADCLAEILNRLALPMLVVSHDGGFLDRTTRKRLVLEQGALRPAS